jgi:hypothetical protein
MAIQYQRKNLVMSLHADRLRKQFSYPVVELHLDSSSVTDPDQKWIVDIFRKALIGKDSSIASMQIVPIVFPWNASQS